MARDRSSKSQHTRPPGIRNARQLEHLVKHRERIFAAMLAGALGGDGICGLVCLLLTGDIPLEQVINAVVEPVAPSS